MSNDLSDNEAIFIFFFKPTDNPFIVFGNLSKKKNPNNFLQIFWGVYITCIVSHVRVIKKRKQNCLTNDDVNCKSYIIMTNFLAHCIRIVCCLKF